MLYNVVLNFVDKRSLDFRVEVESIGDFLEQFWESGIYIDHSFNVSRITHIQFSEASQTTEKVEDVKTNDVEVKEDKPKRQYSRRSKKPIEKALAKVKRKYTKKEKVVA